MQHLQNDVRIDVEEKQDGIQLARVAGELDALGAPVLRECVDTRIATAHDFVLDLDEVTFLGSAGLQVLLDTQTVTVSQDLRWGLVGSTRPVARPLQVTGLATRLPLYSSVPRALLGVAGERASMVAS